MIGKHSYQITKKHKIIEEKENKENEPENDIDVVINISHRKLSSAKGLLHMTRQTNKQTILLFTHSHISFLLSHSIKQGNTSLLKLLLIEDRIHLILC